MWHRIDYLAVVQCGYRGPAFTGRLSCYCRTLDHRAVLVEVYLQRDEERPSDRNRPAQKAWFNRRALLLPDVQEAVAREWVAVPRLPPAWSADEAQRAAAHSARLVLERHCPVQRAAPRQDWLTTGTWQAVRRHAAARRLYLQAIASRRVAVSGPVSQCGPSALTGDDPGFRCEVGPPRGAAGQQCPKPMSVQLAALQWQHPPLLQPRKFTLSPRSSCRCSAIPRSCLALSRCLAMMNPSFLCRSRGVAGEQIRGRPPRL